MSEKVTLSDLDNAPATLPHSAEEDPQDAKIRELTDRLGKISGERDELREANNLLRKKVGTLEANNATIQVLNTLITPSATKAFRFMYAYCAFVGAILLLDGFDIKIPITDKVQTLIATFDLDESVLQFLVGSTAVTVIGLVGMVLTGIFVGARK